MGCDIHIITQIKKDGQWQFVPELPEAINCRNYSTFAFLADVRNEFQDDGFQPKGLPDDLGKTKYHFRDYINEIKRGYEERTVDKVKLPDGTYIDTCDVRLKKTVKTKEEADQYRNWSYDHTEEAYTVYDPSILNGERVEIPVKDIMTYEEFVDYYYGDEWDEDAQAYGYWGVDFDCEDYHSHSWLTLKELENSDKTSYTSARCKVALQFYKEFIDRGGVLPEGMEVINESERKPSSIMEAFQMAYNPDVIIYWQPKNIDIEKYPILKAIEELKDIASKYDITDYDNIRIVFAFDN